MSNTLGRKSDSAAIAALVGLLPIFIGILTYGWSNILKNTLVISIDTSYAQEIQKTLQVVVSFFIALVGVILARAIAAEGKRLKVKDPDASHGTRAAYFIVLILISALGTITTFYRIFEEKNIIVEIAEKTKEKIYLLSDDLNSKIKTPKFDKALSEWEQQKKQITINFERYNDSINTIISERKNQLATETKELDTLWKDIEREIRNPQAMGIGPNTRNLLSMAKVKLPTWQLQNIGAGLTCSAALPDQEKAKCNEKIDLWISSNKRSFDDKKENYIDSINQCSLNENLQKDLMDLKKEIPSIQELPKEVNCLVLQSTTSDIGRKIQTEFQNRRPQYSDDEQQLIIFKAKYSNELNSVIEKIDNHLKNTQNISKEESAPILHSSWEKYKEVRVEAKNRNIEIDNSKLPATIDDSKIDYLGQITRTLELMAERWNKPITYFIIFLGVIMDLIMISFYSRTISIGTSKPFDDEIIDNFNG